MKYHTEERLLTIEGMSLSLQGKPILRNLSITIDNLVRPGCTQGQIISLIGPSGIGKTQLFRCLAGLQTPTVGSVLLNEVKTPVAAGDVGVVFQSYPLLKSRTVWGNLRIAAKNGKKTDEDIMKLLARFELVDKKDLYPIQLSGGQRQRIAIIQQILCSTHFFLMDEPFSGLDVKMKNEAARLITEVGLADELNTIIITTHDIDMALKLSDTVWVLGYDRDEKGERILGSYIVKKYDLAAMGLAWDPNQQKNPLFMQTFNEIVEIFNHM